MTATDRLEFMLRFYTAGESHGQALLAFVSGLPAGLPVDLESINRELHRRQLGYGRGGRQKIEKDKAEIFAGVRHGQTIGAPIALRIENRDWANWEKILPSKPIPEDDATAKNSLRRVPATPIWPVRKNSISRCTVHFGARFRPRNRSSRCGRSVR